jgi:hypothetical protein
MLLSAVSVWIVAQSSSEIPEGVMNNPVYVCSMAVTGCDAIFWLGCDPMYYYVLLVVEIIAVM